MLAVAQGIPVGRLQRWVVAADDKKRARLNTIRHLLSVIPYEDIITPRGQVDLFDFLLRRAARLVPAAVVALYLWHAPVLVVVAPVLGGYPGLGAGFVLATTAATASVLLVERPFRRARLRERTAALESAPP
jgi:peptidoglycan/LPS O-acetylase OafA/YrhL